MTSCLSDSLLFAVSASVYVLYAHQVSHRLSFPLSFVGDFDSLSSWWETLFFSSGDAGIRVKAERWSDGPPLLPDLLPLLCVVDLLLGGAVEERERKSDWGMASRAQTLSVRTFIWRWVAWKFYFWFKKKKKCYPHFLDLLGRIKFIFPAIWTRTLPKDRLFSPCGLMADVVYFFQPCSYSTHNINDVSWISSCIDLGYFRAFELILWGSCNVQWSKNCIINCFNGLAELPMYF